MYKNTNSFIFYLFSYYKKTQVSVKIFIWISKMFIMLIVIKYCIKMFNFKISKNMHCILNLFIYNFNKKT